MLKKLFAVMLSAVMILSVLPLSLTAFAGNITSGFCGAETLESVKWELDADASVLTITGTGAIANGTQSDSPVPQTAETVVIGEGVTNVSSYLFYQNHTLKTVQLSDTVKAINECAFGGCNELETINLDGNVESIGRAAFLSCSKLSEVNLGNKLTSISNGAFNGCTGIISITIPDSVTTIGASLFIFCSNLKHVVLGRGIKIIPVGLFHMCSSLESVVIPLGVERIESGVFYDCTSLTDIYFGGTLAQWNKIFNMSNDEPLLSANIHTEPEQTSGFCGADNPEDVQWTYDPDTSVVTFTGTGDIADATAAVSPVPFTAQTVIIGEGITNVSAYLFYQDTSLKTVQLPSTVKSIDDYAFCSCTALENINLNNVTKVGYYAFGNCTALESFNINIPQIGDNAFAGCLAFTSLAIGEDVEQIGESAFANCVNIETLTIAEGVSFIDQQAFACCRKLESVIIPDSAKMGSGVFVYCSSLKTAKLGDGLSDIPEELFYNCTSLESVILPNYRDITICADAFKNCPALTDIYYGGTLAEWSGEYTDTFGDKYPYVEIREGNDILKSVTVHPINGGECQHVFESETIPASCIHGGYTLYTCTLCGYSYTDNETGVIDHSYGDWIVTVQPTCIYPGEKYRVCSVCNNEEWVDLKPLGHSATSVMVKNPTVDEEGEMQSVCTTCGKVLSTAVIPKLIDDRTRGITLSSEKEMLLTGESVTLTASIIPDTATNKNVIWTSSDTSVATVDNGTVSAVNTGAAVIVAKTEDTGYTAFCLVQVFSVNAVNGAHLDNSTGFIYGLTPNLDSVADYLELDDESVSITYSADVIGTGTVIEVKQNDTTIKKYQAVIFGDVNGDGIYDGQDAFIVNCIATGALTREQVGEAKYLAADCNHDGLVDSSDVMILQKAGVLLAQVNQSESDTGIEENQAYQDYIELIDQNPAAEDQPVEEPEPEVQPASLIDRIIEFIKKVVDFFRSIISKF